MSRPPLNLETWLTKKNKYLTPLILLLLGSLLIRTLLALIVELGNDEAYYRIFALFPQTGYYDHPPLVAHLIRITTWATGISSELLIRLSAIIFGTLNTLIIYNIAKNPIFRTQSTAHTLAVPEQRDFRRGFICATLYTGSIYASIICGVFIMPDSPMSTFWLGAIYYATLTFPPRRSSRYKIIKMLMFGVMCALAILSKYTGFYLLFAAFLYAILYYRGLFCRISTYTALALVYLIISPLLDWNIENDFVSFRIQGDRVVGGDFGVQPLYFIRELFGSFFYNGMVNVVIIGCAFWAYFRKKEAFISKTGLRILLLFSLPFIGIFLIVSLFKSTLPHWSAPGFFALMVFAASYLNTLKWRIIRRWLFASVGSTILIVMLGVAQIKFGLFVGADNSQAYNELGRNDVSLDMYGWRQLNEKFEEIYRSDIEKGIMPKLPKKISIYSNKWYEAAHLDTYIATPRKIYLKTIFSTDQTNLFYQMVSLSRGDYCYNKPGYYIVSSRLYDPNSQICKTLGVTKKTPHITIPIERGGETVMNFMVYRINPLR